MVIQNPRPDRRLDEILNILRNGDVFTRLLPRVKTTSDNIYNEIITRILGSTATGASASATGSLAQQVRYLSDKTVDIYAQLLGTTASAVAASATGSLAQMLEYLAAKMSGEILGTTATGASSSSAGSLAQQVAYLVAQAAASANPFNLPPNIFNPANMTTTPYPNVTISGATTYNTLANVIKRATTFTVQSGQTLTVNAPLVIIAKDVDISGTIDARGSNGTGGTAGTGAAGGGGGAGGAGGGGGGGGGGGTTAAAAGGAGGAGAQLFTGPPSTYTAGVTSSAGSGAGSPGGSAAGGNRFDLPGQYLAFQGDLMGGAGKGYSNVLSSDLYRNYPLILGGYGGCGGGGGTTTAGGGTGGANGPGRIQTGGTAGSGVGSAGPPSPFADGLTFHPFAEYLLYAWLFTGLLSGTPGSGGGGGASTAGNGGGGGGGGGGAGWPVLIICDTFNLPASGSILTSGGNGGAGGAGTGTSKGGGGGGGGGAGGALVYTRSLTSSAGTMTSAGGSAGSGTAGGAGAGGNGGAGSSGIAEIIRRD